MQSPRHPHTGPGPRWPATAISTPRLPWALALGLALAAGASTAATEGAPATVIARIDTGAAPVRVADNPLASELETSLRGQLQQLALDSSRQAMPGVSRVDIEVGQLDPRLKLAPCQRVEPYLPPGTRLWGKARIGLRCTQGSSLWNVYLPITVRVFGPAWVAAQSLAPGAVLGAHDLVQAEVDWAEETSPVVTDPDAAVGRALLRRVTAGQGVRLADLRPRQWFQAGDVVKVVAAGPGFAVTSSGEALNHGLESQAVRVRTEGGRIVVGQAVGDRRVEIRP